MKEEMLSQYSLIVIVLSILCGILSACISRGV